MLVDAAPTPLEHGRFVRRRPNPSALPHGGMTQRRQAPSGVPEPAVAELVE